MTQQQVIKTIRNCIEATGSLREQARLWGISAAYLSDVMNGRRYPGKKILSKIGLEAKVTTVRTFTAGASKSSKKASEGSK
jgi:hypothetical protein